MRNTFLGILVCLLSIIAFAGAPSDSCQMNFSVNKEPGGIYVPGEYVGFVYDCPGVNKAFGHSIPVEIEIVSSDGNIAARVCPMNPGGDCDNPGRGANWACNSDVQTYPFADFNILYNSFGLYGTQSLTAKLISTESDCNSSQISFLLNKPSDSNLIPINLPQTPDCNIKAVYARSITFDSNVNVTYLCNSIISDSNLAIINPDGVVVGFSSNINCSPSEKSFRNLVPIEGQNNFPDGVYSAKVIVPNCSKEFFFAVSKKNKSPTIPDMNLLLVLLSFILIMYVITRSKKK